MQAKRGILLVLIFFTAALGPGCQGDEDCTPDCVGKVCGYDNGCEGICTACPTGQFCNATAGECQDEPCVPDCATKECGDDDGCGGHCTACPAGFYCNATTWTCEDGGPCPGVPANADAECEACRSAACCREAQECLADTDCAAWLTCEDACAVDDVVCQNTCWSTLPAGREKAAYMACKQRACAGICTPAECSEDYGYFDEDTNAECLACRNQHCCNEMISCWRDEDCVFALECYNTCPDMACMLERCNSAEYRPYLMKIAPDWACRNRHCLEACDGECSLVFMSLEPTCQTCIEENCCAEFEACSDDVECIMYNICRGNCGTENCRNECARKYWIGGGLEMVRSYCLLSKCVAQCGGIAQTCGGLPYTDITCKNCMTGNCCAEAEACGTDPACAGLFLCLKACAGDVECRQECLSNATTDGVLSLQALEVCRSGQCANECTEFVPSGVLTVQVVTSTEWLMTRAYMDIPGNGPAAVEGAIVVLDRPNGRREEKTTGADGRVTFDLIDWSLGTANVTAWKEGMYARSLVGIDEAAAESELTAYIDIPQQGTAKWPYSRPAPQDFIQVSGAALNMPASSNYLGVYPTIPSDGYQGSAPNWSLSVKPSTPFTLLAVGWPGATSSCERCMDSPNSAESGFVVVEHDGITAPTTLDLDFGSLTPSTTVSGSFALTHRTEGKLYTQGFGFILVENPPDETGTYFGISTSTQPSADGSALEYEVSYYIPAGADPWTTYWIETCMPHNCRDDEFTQVLLPGVPPGGLIDPQFLEPPTMTQPASPTTPHPLHQPIDWTLYDTDVLPTLTIWKTNGDTAWKIEAVTDAVTLAVPELPSTVTEADLLGTGQLTAVLSISRERGIRYAHATKFLIQP